MSRVRDAVPLLPYDSKVVWQVGVARITRVVEDVLPFDVDFFDGATPADVRAEQDLLADFIDASGRYLMALQTFVIEVGARRIAVDTGCGNLKTRPLIPEFDQRNGPFLDRLRSAGLPPATIDTVVCTHLHFDHVGWNTQLVDGAWVPTFPNARYLFGAADLDPWAQSQDPLHAPAFADSVQPVLDAGLADPVAGDTVLADGVRLQMTPGHTPGHLSVWIGDQCLITGDVLHHPIQCRHPEWPARGDADPDLARATRQQMLAEAAKSRTLVLGTHFAGPAAGRIHATPAGYRFVPERAT